MAKWLYKYGAYILWILIVIIMMISKSIYISVSTILIFCAIGLTFDDWYIGRINTQKQLINLTENDTCVLLLALAILTSNWYIIIGISILFSIYHILRHRLKGIYLKIYKWHYKNSYKKILRIKNNH